MAGAKDVDYANDRLCLELANTLEWHASQEPVETLHDYGDLLSWAQKAGILAASEAEELAQAALQNPGEAGKVFQRSIELREAIYRAFAGVAQGGEIEAGDLERINAAVTEANRHVRIVKAADRYAWGWEVEAEDLERILWPVARSAAAMLTSPALLERVGQCADERGCGWLFLDMSKNHSRRWCDINDCGNRAKQRRHYQKERQTQEIKQ